MTPRTAYVREITTRGRENSGPVDWYKMKKKILGKEKEKTHVDT